ncbi:MAG: hypothetical protein KDD76_04450 [Rickettsiales bacterium]|nr:hypothetical protein [Rickettsiales bacterium]
MKIFVGCALLLLLSAFKAIPDRDFVATCAGAHPTRFAYYSFLNNKASCQCLYDKLKAADLSEKEILSYEQLIRLSEFSKIKQTYESQKKVQDYIDDNSLFKTCNTPEVREP